MSYVELDDVKDVGDHLFTSHICVGSLSSDFLHSSICTISHSFENTKGSTVSSEIVVVKYSWQSHIRSVPPVYITESQLVESSVSHRLPRELSLTLQIILSESTILLKVHRKSVRCNSGA